ncbi:MAG: thiolase family protein [Thermoprotei archaeon]
MDAYIVSAARSPIGKFGGVFKDTHPVELGAQVVREVLNKSRVDPASVDLVVFGNVLRAGHGQDIGRQVSVRAGIPSHVDAYSVDMVCSSGMMAVINAAQAVSLDDARIVLAGGVESMSQAGFVLSGKLRWGVKSLKGDGMGLVDVMFRDGLIDPFNLKLMGEEADMVASEMGVKRVELDEVAYTSHMRAYEAYRKGLFEGEVVPVKVDGSIVTMDQGIRQDTSPEKLASLPPAFSPTGLHTAGSSSQISDGAAGMLIMNSKALDETGVKPIAKILGYSWIGTESWRFVEAPVPAVRKLLDKLNMELEDFDYFENNEAFALSSVIYHKKLGVDYSKLNALGGAIALGHPLGATGARIIVTLITALKRLGGKRGIASLCHGVGGATAIAVELT